MEALQFKIQLKSGTAKTASALLITYNKTFAAHRFLMSTGIQVKRSGFDAARPGKALKAFIAIAEKATIDLRSEGIPLNNSTLKQRIELMAKMFVMNGTHLSAWVNGKAKEFFITSGVDTKLLIAQIKNELGKNQPDLEKVIASQITKGANELFGFWEAFIVGTVKTRGGERLRPISVINKRQTLKIVKAYNPNLCFADMTVAFYNAFVNYLEGKQYDPNSIGKHIREIKSVLHRAKING